MTGKQESGSESSKLSDEEIALKGLLDAFGSACSLEEITSAYCRAGMDANLAAKFLVEIQGNAGSTVDMIHSQAKGSEESVNGGNAYKQSCEGNAKPRLVGKIHPVSIGSVSSIIGRSYIWTTQPKNGPQEATKPLKLDSNVLPESAIWGEETKPSCGKNGTVHREMEEFLFSILGHGFKLERDVIREVLGACGYNMPQSMEKLIGLSTEALGKANKSICDSTNKFSELGTKAEVPTRKSKNHLLGTDDAASNIKVELHSEQNRRNGLQREVLTALFGGSETERDDLIPKKRLTAVRRLGIAGDPVTEPLCDTSVVSNISAVYAQKQDDYAKDQEERCQARRKAVMEYHTMMKEYYQSAAEAYANGDPDRARKLSEQAFFFYEKASEANEELGVTILETRNVKAEDAMVLDLHENGAKEAIRLLRCHLSSFSGISFKYLKLIIAANEEDTTKGSRKRAVVKLLERESINWVEEENGQTILIKLENINRRKLSFVQK